MIRIIVFCLILTALIESCTPVRSNYFGNRNRTLSRQFSNLEEPESATREESNEKRIPSPPAKNYKWVMDTTFIDISDKSSQNAIAGNYEKPKITARNVFDDIMALFDKGENESAERQFSSLLKDLPENSDLYFETKYMICECSIERNNDKEAEIMLNELLKANKTQEDVKQKTLVSLGQVYCRQGKTKQAEEMFQNLKNQYPDSKYIPFANCKSAGND